MQSNERSAALAMSPRIAAAIMSMTGKSCGQARLHELHCRHRMISGCERLEARARGVCCRVTRQASPGTRAAENAAITAEIETVFQEHRGFYGSPRIRAATTAPITTAICSPSTDARRTCAAS